MSKHETLRVRLGFRRVKPRHREQDDFFIHDGEAQCQRRAGFRLNQTLAQMGMRAEVRDPMDALGIMVWSNQDQAANLNRLVQHGTVEST